MYYHTGEEVKKGDVVLWAGKNASIEFLVRPYSKEASSYGLSEEGIMLCVDWGNEKKNSIFEIPEDGVFDEDIEFIRRCK